MQVRYNELTDFEELNVQNEAQAKITIILGMRKERKKQKKTNEKREQPTPGHIAI